MKTLIFSALFAASSVAVAATCPSQTKTMYNCASTPKAGDSEVASDMFDSIAVCGQGSTTMLVVEKNGQSESAEAQVSVRAGGTTYLLTTPDIDFSLSVTTGIFSQELPGQFTVNLKGPQINASSSYTCKK